MNRRLTEGHKGPGCSVVMTFLFAVAVGVLLAFVALGYDGRTESADSPAPPSTGGRVRATA